MDYAREDGRVSDKGIARRRPATVMVVGVPLLASMTVGLHYRYLAAPLWMVAAAAVLPALFVTGACVALADRFKWLPEAVDDDSDSGLPGWVHIVGSIVDGFVLAWFGESWAEHWRHIYPAAPAWMPYLAIFSLFGIATVAVEIGAAEVFELARAKRRQPIDQGIHP